MFIGKLTTANTVSGKLVQGGGTSNRAGNYDANAYNTL